MASVDCEEHVEVSPKWCKLHKTKSLFQLINCPLFFLFWPELPVLTPDTFREPLEEVYELCELCGKSYKTDSLPVDGHQVGADIGTSIELTCKSKSKLRVTFSPSIDFGSNISGINERSRGEEEGTEERKLIGGKANGIATKLCVEEKAEVPTENEEDGTEINLSEKTCRSRLEVTFASSTAADVSYMSDNNGSCVEEEREIGERKLVKHKSDEIPTNLSGADKAELSEIDEEQSDGEESIKHKSDEIPKNLSDADKSELSAEDEDESDDEDSVKQKKRCLPFKKKKYH